MVGLVLTWSTDISAFVRCLLLDLDAIMSWTPVRLTSARMGQSVIRRQITWISLVLVSSDIQVNNMASYF